MKKIEVKDLNTPLKIAVIGGWITASVWTVTLILFIIGFLVGL